MVIRLLAVLCGGLAGTLLRLAVDLALPHSSPGALSVSTIVVNTVGSFVLGVLTSHLWLRPSTPEWVRIGVGPGLLGSFTTFSAIALNAIAGINESRPTDALLALALSLLCGLAAAWAGLKIGARLHRGSESS
ncbi:MAG: CrcB family protein [Microbacteriaceae bacterium]|nr:CrcB family protein [Microbacteriaceae bacterium]